MRLIVFTGPKGSGKDEAAKRLFTRNQSPMTALRLGDSVKPQEYVHCNFAFPLKYGLQAMLGFTWDELNKAELKEKPSEVNGLVPREAMKSIAKWGIENYGDGVWAEAWATSVLGNDMNSTVVCTDMRRPAEFEVFRRIASTEGVIEQATLVYVRRHSVEEAMYKGQRDGDPAWTDDSEKHYDFMYENADILIDNNSSLNDLYTQVDTFFPKAQ